MIYNITNELKHLAISNPLVNMASIGDINLYQDKATIKYPYVNFDVVNTDVYDFVATYNIRMYVCDRNTTPYIAYNKCETIANDLLKEIEIKQYTINYFTLNFKDVVDGVWVDFELEVPIEGNCAYKSLFGYQLLEEGNFTLQENGDLIILN